MIKSLDGIKEITNEYYWELIESGRDELDEYHDLSGFKRGNKEQLIKELNASKKPAYKFALNKAAVF
jgi:hypothetical protein